MPSLFFYGTLCHVPLLEVVLGRSVEPSLLVPAKLPGHAVYWAQDGDYPVIVPHDGAVALGLLLRNLDAADVARLDFYEGAFAFELRALRVTGPDGPEMAEIYFPSGNMPSDRPWALSDWVRDWGRMTVNAAQDVMAQFGQRSAQEVAPIRPFLLARGWARQMAERGAPTELRRKPRAGDLSVAPRSGGFEGFFRLAPIAVSHRRYDGQPSETFQREVFVAFDAALVLPYDPQTDRVVLIEQLRFGPILRNDPAPWVLEPIAGLVDAGEDPADAARREAHEEAGIELEDLHLMTRAYASPGYSSEFFHCYLGICDLDGTNGGVGGLDSEHEDIRSHVVSFDRAMELVESGEINSVPLMGMLMWLARYRDRMRGAG